MTIHSHLHPHEFHDLYLESPLLYISLVYGLRTRMYLYALDRMRAAVLGLD